MEKLTQDEIQFLINLVSNASFQTTLNAAEKTLKPLLEVQKKLKAMLEGEKDGKEVDTSSQP